MQGLRVLVAGLAGLLVACAGSETAPTEEPASQTSSPVVAPTSPSAVPTTASASATTVPTTTEPAPGTIITTAASEFGDVLFDGTGQAVYLFDLEDTAVPACYDQCAVEWPPVLTVGTPVAGGGATADLIGTIARTDGSTQVTYGGHPLYTYAHEGPNEVRCHNVTGFGGLWFALSPAGDAAPI